MIFVLENNMKLYDVHGHLNSQPLVDNVENVIQKMREKNTFLNCTGFDLNSSMIAVDLAKKYSDCVHATIAIHPNDVHKYDIVEVEKKFRSLLNEFKQEIVAIGECGLDIFYSSKYLDLQIEWLQMHAQLASEFSLPLVLHIRDSHERAIEFLKQSQLAIPIIIHCFSQDFSMYQKYESTNLNLYYSIPGIVTFNNASALQDAVKKIPIEKILSETDCPWLTPVPYRGKLNYPYFVEFIVKKIAELRQEPVIKIADQIFQNAQKLFRKK